MPTTSTVVHKQDIERLEDQLGQLIRIIANLNERINYLETIKTNPFLIPSKSQ
ncbi:MULTISPECIES: hypothetical protein [Sporosarcina]|uniref:hypothetical protein n=1 Tax=Sporosarcina TaxID=1569 RepID=UPI0018DE8F3E|nr:MULTISPECIES: hypothetical protein [Sporosarcina]